MDENEILARFGIGKKFAYGLFIQSILVIISAILALNTLQWQFFNGGTPADYIRVIVVFVICISLVVYSFYEYNRDTEYFFIISIMLYIINKLLWIIPYLLNHTNNLFRAILAILMILEVINAIYFVYAFNKKHTSAKYAIILIVILEVLTGVHCSLFLSSPWYGSIPYIVISVSIALTYFERVQRGKYPKLK